MRILFITTHNLATNPRLVKEIKLALDEGFTVQVVCFEFKNWSYDYNNEIIKSLKNASFIIIPANRKPAWPWFKSVLLEKLFFACANIFPLKGFYLSQAVSRRTILLIYAIKKITGNFDWVIGHNHGAIYPAIYASKKFNCKPGFDMEDYHPGEGNDIKQQGLIKKLLLEQLPKFRYISFASAEIKNRVVSDFGKEYQNWFIVLNYFSKTSFVLPASVNEDALKLVWFSQNINYGRGLEQVIPVIEGYFPKVKLTLIGNKHENFYTEFISKKKSIEMLSPMNQQTLHIALSKFDVGLAIEPGKDLNNRLAVSNKLLAYYQAGLFIVASDTPAHKNFFEKKPGIAIVTPLEKDTLMTVVEKLIVDKDTIRRNKQQRFTEAQSYNWESASQVLLNCWKSVGG